MKNFMTNFIETLEAFDAKNDAVIEAALDQAEGIKPNHGRYTLEEAAAFISEQTGEDANGLKNRFIAAVKNDELASYGPYSFVKKDSKIVHDVFEHVYWSDLNEWLKKNEPVLFRVFQFPNPVAPAAKVEAVSVTSPSGEEIPGKIPRTTSGKLAIKAAWQIECETGKRATARQVIEKLQSWVDHKDNPDAVAELHKKIPNGVNWVTTAGIANDYDIGACQKTLETWNKSRA